MIFGFDYFICYSHFDGKAYAKALHRELSTDFVCFLDDREFAAGDSLPLEDGIALRNTSCLILIASPGAKDSEWVKWELQTFQRRRRRILPIRLAPDHDLDAKSKTVWEIDFDDVLWLSDLPSRLPLGPSEGVVERVRGGFNRTRQAVKRLRIVSAAAAILAVAGGMAVWQAVVAQRETNRAQTLLVENQRQLQVERGMRATLLSQQGQPAAALETALASVEIATGNEHPANETYVGLHAAVESLRDGVVLNDAQARVTGGAFSASHQWLALFGRSPELSLFDARSAAFSHMLTTATEVREAAFAPDEKSVLVLGEESNEIVFYSVQGETLGRVAVDEQRALDSFTIESGGKYLFAWGTGAPKRAVTQVTPFDPGSPTPWGPYVFDLATRRRIHAFIQLVGAASANRGPLFFVDTADDGKALIDFDPERIRDFQRWPVDVLKTFPAASVPSTIELAQERYRAFRYRQAAAFSAAGGDLCFGALDGTITRFDTRTRENIWSVAPVKAPVTLVRWSPDGASVAVGYKGGEIAVLRASDGTPRWTSGMFGYSSSALPEDFASELSWSPNSSKLFVSWPQRDAAYLNVADAHPLQPWDYTNDLLTAAASPDHSRLLTISKSGIARLHFADKFDPPWWADPAPNGAARSLLRGVTRGTPRIERVFGTDAGARVLFIEPRKSLRLIDPQSNTVTFTASYAALGCEGATLNFAGTRLFCADDQGGIFELDVQSGATTRKFAVPQPSHPAQRQDGQRDALIDDKDPQGFGVEVPKRLPTEEPPELTTERYLESLPTSVLAMSLSHDDHVLFVGTSRGEVLRIDLGNASVDKLFETAAGRIFSIAAFHDGSQVAIVGENSVAYRIRSRNADSKRLASHVGNVHAVAISPDDRWIVTGGRDGIVRVFKADSAELSRSFDSGSGSVMGLAVSPDGEWLAVIGESGGPRVFELASGKLRDSFSKLSEQGSSLTWLEGGAKLMVAGHVTAKSYDLRLDSLVREAREWLTTLGAR